MPRFTTVQQRFTQGELDPTMIARDDIDRYYGALASAKDIITLAQGGFKRRPGLEHIDRVLGGSLTKISSTSSTPNTGGIGTTNPYASHQEDAGSAVDMGVLYLNGAALSTGSSDEFFLQVSTDASTWITVGDKLSLTTTSKDYTRRVHGSYRYARLVRLGSTDLSTATVSITSLEIATESGTSASRCIDFEFNVEQTYKMVATDKNIAIYQDKTYLIDIYIADLTESLLPSIDWESDADTLLIFNGEIETLKIQRNGANDVWTVGTITYTNIPSHAFTGAVYATPAGSVTANAKTGSITLTGSGTNFTAALVGQFINYIGGGKTGRMKVTAVNSTTELEADVSIELTDTASTATGDWETETGYEEVWSVSRGYPRRGSFYQGRLYVDGGKSRPSVLYGSKVNDFFNFDFGTFLDDEAIGPLSGGFDDIEAIYPGRNLMVYTSKGEYIIPQTFGDPVTPANANMTRQTSIGSERNFRPQEVEGGVMYVQREGSSIQEFIYDDGQQAFSNNFVSLLSSHLIKDPKDFALRKATSTEEGAYLLLVKGDGNLTVANILRNQQITSFVEARTQGNFKSCGVDVEDMYFVVEREIDGQTINWLERFNNDHYMDASTRFTVTSDTDTFTGLEHIEGEECRILADDAILGNETVASGSVTIDRNATESCEIGLNFTPFVKDLPASLAVGLNATIMGMKTNISEISLRMEETAGIKVDGKMVSFRGFGPSGGGSPLNKVPTRFTGVKRILGGRGWNEDAQIEITQDDPLPMTVLAIKKRINV